MNPPPIEELGLPPQFDHFRETQWEVIENGVTCEERVDAHSVPTGGGKTLDYMVQIALSIKPGQRFAIITATKGLQDRLIKEFGGHFPMVNIMGKSNYTCTGRPNWTCEDGHAGRCPNAGTVNCAYSAQYFKAICSRIVLTNYSFWISIHKYGHGLGVIDHVWFDEAHATFNELSNAVQLQIGSNEVEDLLGCKFPMAKEDLAGWKSWATPVRQVAQDALKQMSAKITQSWDVKRAWIKEYGHLRHLVRRLGTLALIRTADWIVDDWEHGFQFDSIKPSRYAESLLYLKIPRITFFSATLTTKVLSMVGVRENFKFWEYPSIFNSANNPIIHVPTCRMNEKMTREDMILWLQRADQIIGPRRDRRGIFHTVSYPRRDAVIKGSKFARWMMTNKKGDITADVVDRFLATAPPAVLVSPSLMTGWDLKYDQARYQIIGKVPWPNIGSKLYKAREEYDPMYGGAIAAQGLEQASGRIVRAEDDWGETFVLDDGVWGFIHRYRGFLSKSFHERYQNVVAIPKPPELGRDYPNGI